MFKCVNIETDNDYKLLRRITDFTELLYKNKKKLIKFLNIEDFINER